MCSCLLVPMKYSSNILANLASIVYLYLGNKTSQMFEYLFILFSVDVFLP